MDEAVMDLYTLQIFMPAVEAAKAQPDLMSYATSLLTPVVALFGIWFARSQSRTARMKLKLELFEKRIVVYDAVRKAFGDLMMHGKPTPDLASEYLTGIAGAKWLFDEKLDKYLNSEVWTIISRLHVAAENQKSASPDERKEAVQKQYAILGEIHKHLDNIDSRFAPFLSLGH